MMTKRPENNCSIEVSADKILVFPLFGSPDFHSAWCGAGSGFPRKHWVWVSTLGSTVGLLTHHPAAQIENLALYKHKHTENTEHRTVQRCSPPGCGSAVRSVNTVLRGREGGGCCVNCGAKKLKKKYAACESGSLVRRGLKAAGLGLSYAPHQIRRQIPRVRSSCQGLLEPLELCNKLKPSFCFSSSGVR